MWSTTQIEPVILHPRPLEKQAGGILLLPLLPYRSPLKPLPAELWSKVFTFIYYDDRDLESGNVERFRLELLTVCKGLHVCIVLLWRSIFLTKVTGRCITSVLLPGMDTYR